MDIEERIAKLPNWVQEHIKDLTRERDSWKHLARDVWESEPTDVSIKEYGPRMNTLVKYLDNNTRIQFQFGDNPIDYVEVYRLDDKFRGKRLAIHSGMGQLAVRPIVSNSLEVFLDEIGH